MKKFWLIFLASVLLLSNCNDTSPITPTPTPPPPAFIIDHFKAYTVEIIVPVDDQFIEPQEITLEQGVKFFATPVDKDGVPKLNDKAHLAWYKVKSTVFANKDITYFNQFTARKEKKIRVGKLIFLLVPNEKIINNSEFPKLDYYLCYEIINPKLDQQKQVALVDQFQTVNSTPNALPFFFCNPCSKKKEPIINKLGHLVIYKLPENKAVNKSITIKNPQFGGPRFTVQQQEYLLVPSRKELLTPGTGQPGKPPEVSFEPGPGQPGQEEISAN